MRPRNLIGFAFLFIFASLTILGCGSGSPSSPSLNSPDSVQTAQVVRESNDYLWGLYDISIDSISGEIDIVPMRSVMFEANVTRFLHPPLAPIDLLTLQIQPGTDFQNGLVLLDIAIKHPFPATNLRGFDVMGIFMAPEGANPGLLDPSLKYNRPGEPGMATLLNPDGYTRWWNQGEFTTVETLFGYQEGRKAVPGFTSTCTLNGYRYFADGFEPETAFNVSNLLASDRGSFSTIDPGLNKRRFEIQFPADPSGNDFRFKYAISSSYWGPEGDFTPPAQSSDFPLSANRAEAVQISVVDTGGTAFLENDSTYGGDLMFDLTIVDWQGLENFGGAFGEVGGVYAESPTLFDGFVDLTATGIWTYEPMNPIANLTGCRIPNVTPSDVEGQYLMITILSAAPTDYSAQIDDVTGFDYPESAQLAAHMLWEAPISPIGLQSNLPPVADASLTDPTQGEPPLQVDFNPSASYDPDGVIVLYEWDIENDGIFDYTTLTPDIVQHTYDNPSVYEVQLRVTDDDDAVDLLDDPLIIRAMDDPCATGPNLVCSGDGNIFTDGYVTQEDNEQFFRNVIAFDLGGPNSYNKVVKYYTGHGGNHNASPIIGNVKTIIESEGYTLVDTNEEPVDLTGIRIIFVCLPGDEPGFNPFTDEEYDDLKQFMADGGRIVLTQEYSDGEEQRQVGNDFLDGINSSIDRLNTSTSSGLWTNPNDCYALTDGVERTYNPAYTSFEIDADDFSIVTDLDGLHVMVADWIYLIENRK